MKKISILYSTILFLLLTSTALAVPVTFDYTTDNVTLYFATLEIDLTPSFNEGVLDANFDDWRAADSFSLDVEAGSYLAFMFIGQNVGAPNTGNPGGFLADVHVGDTTFSTSSDGWWVAAGDFRYNPFISFDTATSYGTNANDPNIWAYVPGISDDAEWIWTADNFADAGSPEYASIFSYVKIDAAPVPEPATMLLLGTGLVGLAATSRKKIFKKK